MKNITNIEKGFEVSFCFDEKVINLSDGLIKIYS